MPPSVIDLNATWRPKELNGMPIFVLPNGDYVQQRDTVKIVACRELAFSPSAKRLHYLKGHEWSGTVTMVTPTHFVFDDMNMDFPWKVRRKDLQGPMHIINVYITKRHNDDRWDDDDYGYGWCMT